jgi:hypothetical protein
MKKFILTLLMIVSLSFLTWGQSRDSDLADFLGKSQNTISRIWGSPQDSEINEEGYLVWHYTYGEAIRSFYFYGNYVELVGSILAVKTKDYALKLAYELGNYYENKGYWIYNETPYVVTVTNGRIYVDIIVAEIRYKTYAFSLLVYR